MNTYKITVQAQCPLNDGDTDLYRFTIKSVAVIPVQKIRKFFAEKAKKKHVYQETLTKQCAVALGAKVVSVGRHDDIEVISEAP